MKSTGWVTAEATKTVAVVQVMAQGFRSGQHAHRTRRQIDTGNHIPSSAGGGARCRSYERQQRRACVKKSWRVTHAENRPFFDRRTRTLISPTPPYVSRHAVSASENGRAEQSGADLEVAAESARFGDASTQELMGSEKVGNAAMNQRSNGV